MCCDAKLKKQNVFLQRQHSRGGKSYSTKRKKPQEDIVTQCEVDEGAVPASPLSADLRPVNGRTGHRVRV